MIFFKMGLRNLFRNKRRSFLTMAAISVAVTGLIVSDGFMEGMSLNMVKTATSGVLGHGQIHSLQYIENPQSENFIINSEKLEQELNEDKLIKSWTKRVYSLGMVASARNARNLSLIGINPKTEFQTTSLSNKFDQTSPGENLSEIFLPPLILQKLGSQVGEKIVLTTTDINTGEIRQDIMYIGGTHSVSDSLGFLHIKKLQELLNLKDNFHEIVLNLGNPFLLQSIADPFWKKHSTSTYKARGWKEINPGIAAIMDMSKMSMGIIGIIMMILMSLIITNALFMAIFERIFEYGVARALGTENKHLVLMMFSETLGLGVGAALAGIILSLIIGGALAIYGVDYSGVEFNQVTFSEPVRFIFRWHQWVLYPGLAIVFTLLTGIYPAYYTTKITLSRALKKTM